TENSPNSNYEVKNIEQLRKELNKENVRNALLQLKVEQLENENTTLKTQMEKMKDNEKKDKEDLILFNKKVDKLPFEIKQLMEGKVCFVNISNKWKLSDKSECCKNKCVNNNNLNAVCSYGNGFIQIINDTNFIYNKCSEEVLNNLGSNKISYIITEICFNKPKENYIFSLYYYEVKVNYENDELKLWIGIKGDKDKEISLCLQDGLICDYLRPNHLYYNNKIKIPSFSFNNNDIIGCGLVYPPIKMNNKYPYIFFTHNGEQIGKAVLLKENFEFLRPFINSKTCSVETNFGENLNNLPFIYDITKHYIAEEFYKDEDLYERCRMFSCKNHRNKIINWFGW
ncbi:hypothetical protein Mgra_00007052, partial [Meloidogyne graminicola]